MDTVIPHGTYGGYTNHACRCGLCRKANRDHQADYKARLKMLPVPERVHGTVNGYGNYGCSCDLCREANNIASSEWNLRRRGVTL